MGLCTCIVHNVSSNHWKPSYLEQPGSTYCILYDHLVVTTKKLIGSFIKALNTDRPSLQNVSISRRLQDLFDVSVFDMDTDWPENHENFPQNATSWVATRDHHELAGTNPAYMELIDRLSVELNVTDLPLGMDIEHITIVSDDEQASEDEETGLGDLQPSSSPSTLIESTNCPTGEAEQVDNPEANETAGGLGDEQPSLHPDDVFSQQTLTASEENRLVHTDSSVKRSAIVHEDELSDNEDGPPIDYDYTHSLSVPMEAGVEVEQLKPEVLQHVREIMAGEDEEDMEIVALILNKEMLWKEAQEGNDSWSHESCWTCPFRSARSFRIQQEYRQGNTETRTQALQKLRSYP
ncbi:hypothetical protein K440DRAFT_324409 [Wilcoxina mikolae CBS 423.85]|nr:hypothetical protein K440DRAFT_324409 [Wilcoxina mikolae CBS 423.85]